MTHETILIVDDSLEFARTLAKYMLAPLGYRVLHAPNGKKGLAMAASNAPDLILLDMNMPKMTGLEMLTALRQTDCRAPVIFMTLHGSEIVAVEAFRLGVRNYLPKPFTPEELQEAVDEALQETRLAREKEALTRNLIVSETIRQTVVTLSHYFNNQLMVLTGGLGLLQEELERGQLKKSSLQTLQDSRDSVTRITAVLRVLQRVTKVRQSVYHGQVKMIDIEAALREELAKDAKMKRRQK